MHNNVCEEDGDPSRSTTSDRGLSDDSDGVVAFRPRLLYSTIYVWLTASCGKFTAPLLQHLSPRFTDSTIGMTFALQYAIVACLAGWGGSLADAQERVSSSWGRGRLKVLSLFMLLATLAFLGHSLPGYVYPGDKESTVTLVWHIAMRCMYAVGFGVALPCLDGLALAHLESMEGASTVEFGKERMYGAIWWGLGSLAAGIGIDYFGFDFLYAILAVSALVSFLSMGIYLWGVGSHKAGAFSYRREPGESENTQLQQEKAESTDGNDQVNISNIELLHMLCKTGYGQAVLLFVFTLSMGIAVVDNLAFIFFDTLGATNTIDGWTVVFTVMFEIPVFYVAPVLLDRTGGPGTLLLAAGIAYVIRVIGYTLVPDGRLYIILVLETLHGLSYAGSKAASVEFVTRMIPKGFEASGQGILIFVTYFGTVVGLVMAGWIQELLGARFMFRVMAAVVFVGISVMAIAECFCVEGRADSNMKNVPHEQCNLVKSDSAFADISTERYIRNLKYDSLNKRIPDW